MPPAGYIIPLIDFFTCCGRMFLSRRQTEIIVVQCAGWLKPATAIDAARMCTCQCLPQELDEDSWGKVSVELKM